MKNILKLAGEVVVFCAAAAVVFLVFLVSLYSVGIPFHEVHLYRTRIWYKQTVPHPPSRPLSRFSEMGNFGNSNHCDYAVGEVRVSPWPAADIARFYERMSIGKIAKKENKGDALWIAALFPEDARDPSSWFSESGAPFRDEFHALALATSTEGTTYMVVFVDAMYPAGFDFRCH